MSLSKDSHGINQPNYNMNRIPGDLDTTTRFQDASSSWSHAQPAPPVPPRNYSATNTSMYPNQPYYQRPYGGDYMGSMGMYGNNMGMGMNNYMYRSPYMNRMYPGQDNYMMPGRYVQMAQDLFSPVFQNSDVMINSLRDMTYTADTALVSVRMLFDALNMVVNNMYKVRDFLQKYAVSFATLGSSHWIFHLIHSLLGWFGLVKKCQTQMDDVWSQVQGDKKRKPSTIANFMALSALIAAFSYVLPQLVEFVKRIVNRDKPKETSTESEGKDWDPHVDKYTPVQAKFSFNASNASEISVKPGEQLRMKSLSLQGNQLPLWVLVANSNFQKGFVPLSYLSPLDK